MRIAIAGFSHETNTFVSNLTTREDFRARAEYVGAPLIEEYRGTNSTFGGAIAVAEDQEITLVPILHAGAQPGGPVARDAYEYYSEEILEGISNHQSDLDGIFLSLHGAMVPEGLTDGEGPLLHAIRDLVGPTVPIVVTLDLHGNVSDGMVEAADALVAYRTYPHVDTAETGIRAMKLLISTVQKTIQPVMAVARPPVVAFTPRQFTGSEPMAAIMEAAKAFERETDIVSISVLPGFSHADVPSMGCSILTVANDNRTAAEEMALRVGKIVWERREELIAEYPDAEAAVERTIDLIETGRATDGPVVLADTGDNPGGGSPADGTILLDALLGTDLTNVGVAIICDPAAVDQASSAGVGEQIRLTLGAKTDDLHGEPIEDLAVTVRTLTDGRFRNTGPMGTGTLTRLGRTARVTCGPENGIHVIITERRVQPLDAEIWRHVGIQPERLDVIVLKSSNHYRADYEPMASHVIPVATPGITAVDPRKFSFEHARRPQFPFDDLPNEAYPDTVENDCA